MLSTKIPEITRIYQQYANQKSSIELEAKFGYILHNRFNSNVPYVHFERLLNHLREVSGPEHVEESNVTSGGNIRRITTISPGNDPESIIWQSKDLIRNYTFDEYAMRISINIENTIKEPDNFIPEVIRERTRRSFLAHNGIIKVDLTEVLMKNIKKKITKIYYEVEVEFIGEPNQLDIFDNYIIDTAKILRGTHILYTEDMKDNLIQDTINILGFGLDKKDSKGKIIKQRNDMIDKGVLVEARNIKRRDLVYGGIVGNKETSYMITYKADGLRKMLIIHTTGIWLVYPPYEFNLVLDINTKINNFAALLNGFNGTILDGELITPKSPTSQFTYLAFDCLSVRQNSQIQNAHYNDRKKIVYALVSTFSTGMKSNIITLDTKRTEEITTPEAFFRLVKDFLDNRDKLPYTEDGVMFFPAAAVYNPHSEQYPLYERSLTRHPDTCKWKETLDITIDFSLRWLDDGRIDVYSYDEESNDEIPFRGTTINPFTNDMIEHQHELTAGKPTGLIVEYEFQKDIKKLIPRRIRYDKRGPNKLVIAQDNWDDIMKPITRADIEGRTLSMVTSYHNRIKRGLYSKIPRGANILDIGSGYGGDVDKWSRQLGLIVAVEPNNKNSTELISRLGTFNMTERVKVVHTGGEDTVAITEAVKTFIPGGKVDAVTLMLSMSFFWSSTEHLDALINTIISNLKPGGMIVFLTQNGDTVEQMFEPKLGGEHITDLNLVTSEFHLHPKPSNIKHGRILDINIPNSIVGKQREYLVKIQDFTLRLESYGIYLNELHRAEGEKLLSNDNAIFSSMFSFGNYINEEEELLLTANIPNENIILPDIKMETSITSQQSLLPHPVVSPLIKHQPTPFEIEQNQLPWLQVSLQGMNVPAINDDTYAPLTCSWYNNLVRIATIGDGSCFIHAVMKAYDRNYQENNIGSYRSNIAAQLRRDIARMLEYENPNYPGYRFWETTARGMFPSILMQEIVNEELVGELGIDYSISGLQRLFNSASYLGDEVYAFVSDALNVDIYVLRATKQDLYPHINTKIQGINRNGIVIVGNTYHYEVLAVDNGELFQTVFPPDDKFIGALSKLFVGDTNVNWEVRQKFDPDETFIMNAIETFKEVIPDTNPVQYRLNIPKRVGEIFPSTDPFILMLYRLMPQIENGIEMLNTFGN